MHNLYGCVCLFVCVVCLCVCVCVCVYIYIDVCVCGPSSLKMTTAFVSFYVTVQSDPRLTDSATDSKNGKR